MSETYTLILDSQNATNITNNANIYSYQDIMKNMN